MLESNRRGESLPPPPLPQHTDRSDSRMLINIRKQSLNQNAVEASGMRPSARPRQRQLAPKVIA